jgi:hypothetical protein
MNAAMSGTIDLASSLSFGEAGAFGDDKAGTFSFRGAGGRAG